MSRASVSSRRSRILCAHSVSPQCPQVRVDTQRGHRDKTLPQAASIESDQAGFVQICAEGMNLASRTDRCFRCGSSGRTCVDRIKLARLPKFGQGEENPCPCRIYVYEESWVVAR